MVARYVLEFKVITAERIAQTTVLNDLTHSGTAF